MVISKKIKTAFFIMSLVFSAQGSAAETLLLNQRKVAELVMSQSPDVKEANLRSELPRLAEATTLSIYNWKLAADFGYEQSKFENFTNTQNLKDEYLRTNVGFTKNLPTGTQLGLAWNRVSLQSEYPVASTSASTLPSRQTQDILGITIQQNLLYNIFGQGDRAQIRSAEKTRASANQTRGTKMQDSVLKGLEKYWLAFVASENFQEALNSRERYKKLVDTIKRKANFNFASPGELSQAMAEFEGREQNVKKTSIEYLAAVDDLVVFLELPHDTKIEFKLDDEFPPPPKVKKVELTELRESKAQSLLTEAAQDSLIAARQLGRSASGTVTGTQLSLVGKLYSSGIEKEDTRSLGEAFSGAYPKYYIGLELSSTFGTDIKDEVLYNKRLEANLAEIAQARQLSTLGAKMENQSRKIDALYSVGLSIREQKILRQKAFQEIDRAYAQGRSGIRDLIESMNNFFATEVAYSKALGDYQTELARWAAIHDLLVPEPGKERSDVTQTR